MRQLNPLRKRFSLSSVLKPMALAATLAFSVFGSFAGAHAQNTVTIRVWGYGLDDARAKARIAVFQKANPNIQIQAVGGSLNTQQLLTAVASGDPPEVINVDRAQVGSWAGRNALQPIDDLIARDKFDTTQFYPFTMNQVQYEGKVYGIPQFVNVDLFFMNVNDLQAAGIDPASVDTGNWEQLQQMAVKLYKHDGTKTTQTGFDTKVQDGRLWEWAWANGVDLISPDGKTAHFNDPKVVEALTWAKAVVDAQGGDQARAAFQQTQNFFSAQNPVLIGQTATTVFEQWLIGVMDADPKANFAVTLPRIRNSTQTFTQASGSAFAIPKGVSGDKRDAAWKFITGMTSTDAWVAGEQATLADDQKNNAPYFPTITGNIAADQQAWTTIYKPLGAGYDQAVKLFPEALKVAKFPYSGPVAADISDMMTSEVNDGLQGVKTPQQAMDELQKNAQQAIDDYSKQPGNS